MPSQRFPVEDTALLVIDIQPSFMAAIHEAERVERRSEFIIRLARLLDVPVLASEQNVARMGGTMDPLAAHLPDRFDKMAFSCAGCEALMERLFALGRRCIALVGIETHICVTQTALDLMERGFTVAACPDAVSARTLERHKLGMERIRDAGAAPVHTEALAYEWLISAEHPRFREALALVKEFA